MKKLLIVLSTVLSIMLVLSACSSTTSTTASQSAKVTTPATQTVKPTTVQTPVVSPTAIATTTPTPTPTPSATVSTKKQYGYVTKAYTSSGKQYITIDYVDMYGGDEAIQKAKEDKSTILEKDEDGKYYIPNDYYIRNVNTLLRTFKMASTYKIELLGDGVELKSATFTQFVAAVKTRKRLVTITFNNGDISSISEVYVP